MLGLVLSLYIYPGEMWVVADVGVVIGEESGVCGLDEGAGTRGGSGSGGGFVLMEWNKTRSALAGR